MRTAGWRVSNVMKKWWSPGRPGLRHLGENLAHQAAKRLLGEHVVANQIVGHRSGP